MKKLVAISIMAALLLTIGAVAMASETDWMMLFKAQTSGGLLYSTIAQAGTLTGATDGYESTKDGSVTFSSGSAGVGILEPTWAASNPPLYGKDAKAPIVAGETKTWDIVLFVGTGYTGTDLKLFWYTATTTTSKLSPTIGGQAYNYTVSIVNDPTGTFAPGTSVAMDGNSTGSSTAPLGSFLWGANAVGQLKLTPTDAINSGIKLRLTAAPAGVIPEPSSMLALASGLVGLAGYALRRRA